MRAQLRTYHSIPSLQAHHDPNAYKQLQDAPRLKSILKGATEDVEQPNTIEDSASRFIQLYGKLKTVKFVGMMFPHHHAAFFIP